MNDTGLACFAEFAFDPRARELRLRGRVVPLEPKPAEMLAALLERPGELVARAELRARLWPQAIHSDLEHGLAKTANKLRAALRDGTGAPRFFETLRGRGYRWIAAVETLAPGDGAAAPAGRLRLAVVPFQNATGRPELDDLADALTEEAIARLGALLRGGIRIIAYASVLPLRNSPHPVAHAARELAVDCVLIGRLRRAGGNCEMRLELVAAADEARLWAGAVAAVPARLSFEPGLAQGVGGALAARVRALPAQCAPLRPGAAGREAYLRGRRLLTVRTEAAVNEAMAEYRRAIHQEPAFALAYAALAECFVLLNSWGAMAPKPSQELAEEAAQKAIQMNPCLPEPQLIAAYSRMILADDWPGAERAFRAAIARNPSYALAHHLYGYWRPARGEFAAGLAANARALDLDPLSPMVRAVRAYMFACAGRGEEAGRVLAAALEAHPAHAGVRYYAGVLESAAGNPGRALEHHAAALRLSGAMLSLRAALAASLAAAGERAAARAHLGELERLTPTRYVCGFFMGVAYAALGARGRAADWMSRCLAARDPHAMFLTVDPRLEALRAEPALAPVLGGVRRWLGVASPSKETAAWRS